MFKLTFHPLERDDDGELFYLYTFATQDGSRSATFAVPPCYTTSHTRERLLDVFDALNFDPGADVAEALGATAEGEHGERRRWAVVIDAIESVVRPAVEERDPLDLVPEGWRELAQAVVDDGEVAANRHCTSECPLCQPVSAGDRPAQVTVIAGEPTPEPPSTWELAHRLEVLTSRVDDLAAALEQLRRPEAAANVSPETTNEQLLEILHRCGLDVVDVLRTACLRSRGRPWTPRGFDTTAAALDYLRGWSSTGDNYSPAASSLDELLRCAIVVRDNFGVLPSRDDLPELIKREAAALRRHYAVDYHTAVPLAQRARLYSYFLRRVQAPRLSHPLDEADPSDLREITKRAQVFADAQKGPR